MAPARRYRPRRTVRLRMTEAATKLVLARLRAGLRLKDLAAGVGIHPRTVARWERGETQPTLVQWSKTLAYLVLRVPAEASDLAQAAGVSVPVPVPPRAADEKLIEEALMRAADMLDVSPRRMRAAVRELAKATVDARGTVDDLARAAQEVVAVPAA